MLCPRCGAESLPTQEFCTKCGTALGTTESAPSAAAPAAEQTVPATLAAPAVPVPPPTLIRPIPDGGLTVEDVAAWLEGEGYAVKFVTGESGKRHIETSTQGSPLNIFLGDCMGERCASLELAAGFSTHGKFDVSQINGWNYDNRWCRAYYDSDNDPWLRMNIDLWPGGTYEALSGRFETWNSTLGRFIDKFGLR
jgi:Putative bacterial sensory transduction regulator/zinc-ribbon domain